MTCRAADELPLDELLDFQGGIKTISEVNLWKLKRRIIEHGINAPVFVWQTKAKKPKRYIIDGHQRCTALRDLRDEGWEIPDVPVAYIEAKSRKDAADKLLAITSQYGNIDVANMQEWIMDIGIDVSDIRIVDGAIDIAMPSFDPVDEHSQGRLDQVGKDVVCPNCGHLIES